MEEVKQLAQSELAALTAEITAAYVSNNTVATADLPNLIATIADNLRRIDSIEAQPEEPKLEPAVPVKKSVTPDFIVCLEDGKKLKMLKRHLKTRYDMTPDQYRQRWGLKDDYPMVAPSYASQRSELARKIGLGKPKGKKVTRAKRKVA